MRLVAKRPGQSDCTRRDSGRPAITQKRPRSLGAKTANDTWFPAS